MADTMEIIETERVLKHTDDGDHDRFQHYFLKKDIEANIFDGRPMTALCGKVVPQQVDPQGRTVCSTCTELMESLVGSNLPEGERD